MGCCASNSSKAATDENPHFHSHSKQSRTPPPSHPLLEEESVKEVLSETQSVPKKPTISRIHQENNQPRKIPSLLSNGSNVPGWKQGKESIFKKPAMILNPEELSEDVSEICSTHSDSVSTATYFTEKNDEDCADIRQRSPAKLRNRSLSGDLRRERVAGKSPAKKSDPSPNRVRSGPRRDARGLGPNVQKIDGGESSGRRSMSPATRSEGGGEKTGPKRNGSAGRNEKSPGRVRSEMVRKLDANDMRGCSNRETRDYNWPPTSNESLENPLVSLECFIFL